VYSRHHRKVRLLFALSDVLLTALAFEAAYQSRVYFGALFGMEHAFYLLAPVKALLLGWSVLVFVGWVVAGYRVGGSVRQTRTLDVRTVFTGLLVISAVHMFAIVLRSLGVGGLPTLLLGIVGYGASLLAALIGLGAILGTRFRRPPLGPDPMSYGPLPPSPGSMMPADPIVTSAPPPSA
jgi:hypothetical protein